MGWCGVGAVIRESIDLSKYPCELYLWNTNLVGGGREIYVPQVVSPHPPDRTRI